MKKIFYLLTILLSLSSCSVEMSNNGDLDGLWQMYEMQIDGAEPVDMRYTGTTMSVAFRMMSLKNYYQPMVYCRFENTGNTLRIYDFRLGIHDVSDLPIEDPEVLNPFGIFSLDEHFKVEVMTGSDMVLRSDRALLKFRKY